MAAYLDGAVHLIVCGPVVAEMLPREPGAETWLEEFGIEVDWNLGRAVWRRVGQAHAEYTRRRRGSGGGAPRGILADYLIGAHAEVNGLPLLTLNEHDYFSFPNLEVLTP
ncbi:type II toxin-antitoxin system VapC family toxin [Deinococcus sp. SM5_A1]|uniref:type II toxin-antitoxin system VapC family toxin n=1 Tax=Deinococcus sp. SM5_A1 TaxID=3379094 RepID=UPI0038581D98